MSNDDRVRHYRLQLLCLRLQLVIQVVTNLKQLWSFVGFVPIGSVETILLLLYEKCTITGHLNECSAHALHKGHKGVSSKIKAQRKHKVNLLNS